MTYYSLVHKQPATSHHHAHSKHPGRTLIFVLAFITLTAFGYSIDRQIQMAQQNIEIDYN